MLAPVLALGMPVGAEWLILAALGLLFFGKRLPEVGRSLGKGILEFKKGLKSVEDDVEGAGQPAHVPQMTSQPSTPLPQNTGAAPMALPGGSQSNPAGIKFDPYTGKPVETPAPKFDPYTGKPLTSDASAGEHPPTQ